MTEIIHRVVRGALGSVVDEIDGYRLDTGSESWPAGCINLKLYSIDLRPTRYKKFSWYIIEWFTGLSVSGGATNTNRKAIRKAQENLAKDLTKAVLSILGNHTPIRHNHYETIRYLRNIVQLRVDLMGGLER